MNFPVSNCSKITRFWFRYLRPVLEPGLPQYPVTAKARRVQRKTEFDLRVVPFFLVRNSLLLAHPPEACYHNCVVSKLSKRNRTRVILAAIALVTIPCYCLGIIVRLLVPDRNSITSTATTTVTSTPTSTYTSTATLTLTPTLTASSTFTFIWTLTSTSTDTPSATPTPTFTFTPTPTSTDTPTSTFTYTPIPPTPTDTPPSTFTDTPIP